VALAALLLCSAHGAHLRSQPKEMNAHKCKTVCQRFGMKFLAKQNKAFEGVKGPTECCKVCDQVYTSLLQTSPVVAEPHPAIPAATAFGGAFDEVWQNAIL
jgi:hypothetical protein